MGITREIETEVAIVGAGPAGLSAAYAAGALSAYREFHTFGVNQLSVGACLYRLFISSKSMEDTEL